MVRECVSDVRSQRARRDRTGASRPSWTIMRLRRYVNALAARHLPRSRLNTSIARMCVGAVRPRYWTPRARVCRTAERHLAGSRKTFQSDRILWRGPLTQPRHTYARDVLMIPDQPELRRRLREDLKLLTRPAASSDVRRRAGSSCWRPVRARTCRRTSPRRDRIVSLRRT